MGRAGSSQHIRDCRIDVPRAAQGSTCRSSDGQSRAVAKGPSHRHSTTQTSKFWHERKVRRSKPVAGTCSRCGRGASVADMKTVTRFCYVPLYWKSWKAIICTFCGAILKSYR
ncbi:hypothetical protein NL676_024170 [Syzygium grande]|nr:hypothetical protein NL676_024170 [Syzygium grande]